ncbi:DAK2 domain-containing protein [Cellulosimicrobium marinum]|uniref:DAK2 domain-containing protein n=1 Tax=Cellulosimicrobium marinum TaxID=1638992 RepID=UPI001E30B69D|nr:DAK2 domain-containing protein [Cellulosimicrobium marinum]MCB7137947.1 DAK2 domain-containing protein [Cellulosimicrobium marinum]
MSPSEVMDATHVRAWARDGVRALDRARGALDRVNVFPVADADTGTNLYLTFLEAARSIAAVPAGAGAGDVLVRLARGALVGARGNSGVILSEYLRGLAVELAGRAEVDGAGLARALGAAAETARRAVAHPAGGTILTAADAAADAARAAAGDAAEGPARAVDRPADVCAAARTAARASALRSRDELDVLARADVLDAGALGLTLLLGVLHAVLDPDAAVADTVPDADPDAVTSAVSDVVSDVLGMMAGMVPVAPDGEDAVSAGPADRRGGEFEVMYVVDATSTPTHALPRDDSALAGLAARLRDGLARVGDSVVVVGGESAPGTSPGSDGLWQAHVHTDHPASALAVGHETLAALPGVPAALRQVRVRHLPGGVDPEPVHRPSLGVVAATTSPGVVADLARAGAVVIQREPGAAPDPLALHRAVVDTGAHHVVLLPAAVLDDGLLDDLRAAVLGDGVERLDVLDAPTDLHVVVALAAGLQADPDDDEARVLAARAALAGVRVAEAAGTGPDPARVGRPALPDGLGRALDAVLDVPAEILTVLVDDDVPHDALDALADRAAARGAETVVLRSGRPGTRVTLGAEPPAGVGRTEEGAG